MYIVYDRCFKFFPEVNREIKAEKNAAEVVIHRRQSIVAADVTDLKRISAAEEPDGDEDEVTSIGAEDMDDNREFERAMKRIMRRQSVTNHVEYEANYPGTIGGQLIHMASSLQ
jgi:hypothetical protein